MTERAPLSREEKSWVLYDAANSAFVLVMITAIMPIYFKDVAASGLADAVATSNWAFANSTASLILALLAPVLGTMADYKDRKKPYFLFFLITGLVFTVALTIPLEGQWLLCLLLFIGARVGWAGANLFYDAFLVDVAAPERMDSVSAKGFGIGYIGSIIPFLAVIALIVSGGLGDGLPAGRTRMGFVVVALWCGSGRPSRISGATAPSFSFWPPTFSTSTGSAPSLPCPPPTAATWASASPC